VLLEGTPLVAMQRNLVADGGRPVARLITFVAGLEYQAERRRRWWASPRPVSTASPELLAVEPGLAMMVGDDLESDLP
jgi:hypothetical protein